MKVKCIDNVNNNYPLTIGKVYRVLEEREDSYIIEADDGVRGSYFKKRFEKLEATPEPKRPPHYEAFILDPITVSVMWNLPPCLAHALKYLVRDKAGAHDDLDKAIRCIQMHKESLARKARINNGEDPNVVWSTKL